ncbi:hypothetical protein BOX15_Mlig010460g1 [Macrostomum lignano]|uniref:Hexosyltransferase n=1 Tax=Macrostomum lignano TaxID=282301 RepID=A0A267DRD6_9PLAT|nr:hypothetical protein BOX15_Mlig010460g1 [Macrostomum lignano]
MKLAVQKIMPCCQIKAAVNCVAILLLSGLLVELLWSHTEALYGRKHATSIVVHPRPSRSLSSCSGYLGLIDCLSNASWSYQPPAMLQAACQQTKTRHLVLVFVPLRANMALQRSLVRQTWGRHDNGTGFELLIFLVQLPEGEAPDPALSSESAKFGDIFLMGGPTEDTYQCLTLKILSFLRWYSQNCSGAFHYLLKSDHDSVWNANSLNRLLRQRLKLDERNPRNSTRHPSRSNSPKVQSASGLPDSPAEILGGIQRRSTVQRHNSSKFCTPPQAFAPNRYPNYVLGGPGYLISDAAATALTRAADRVAPFWLEDVYITGILAAASRPPVRRAQLSHIYYAAVPAALLRANALASPPLGIHGLSAKQVQRLDSWLREPKAVENAKRLHRIHTLT